jgi:hypothetical protein
LSLVDYSREDRVAIIALNRPQQANAQAATGYPALAGLEEMSGANRKAER